MKTECIGMLLAGGEGKRLGMLTKELAKPAVYFGGKYRIIDFTLSNCVNSGIQTVGVLTQYSPLILNKHIGIGRPWGLDRQFGGVSILSPYTAKSGGRWYKGTADAIYQNFHFIEQYDPDYVLVISGDHIYHMNYAKMLDYHKRNRAEATISVIEVPLAEASRFGILNTTENGQIYEFAEKPEIPVSNLASMGVYIFNWQTLKSYLVKDADQLESDHDFGKNIIPAMLNDELRLFAYKFYGYWKDVGTVQSYWEANMDLLRKDKEISLEDREWRTYTHDNNYPPQYVEEGAKVTSSMINSGCWISGEVDHSIVFHNVEVQKGSRVSDSILMPGVVVGEGAVIRRAIIMEDVVIPPYSYVSADGNDEPLVMDQLKISLVTSE
ncbi:glucose-1-phosphate adenylyltransferase [Evansella caseinilytica]|uniref:Glucose-1-phosphate adenylyltransferase n=1 Tax=Evansella caseinilytica TaxID=1503961 RepID=A0A1H3PF65_9BACI|nr:glucose-1-phosphate adenylyltransferase [Evansella caseinilytica]SDY99794.1 glucose-1-phosphate adenylyltransferase [Evansella caseinilytica]